jgi:predicted nucleic acid-binding Zn ribbon protein
MNRRCVICGEGFAPRGWGQKTCSPEHGRQLRGQRYVQDRDYRERAVERARNYRAANLKRVAEYQKKYHAANRERLDERRRQHYAANRERLLEWHRQYYAANRKAPKRRCVICGEPFDPHSSQKTCSPEHRELQRKNISRITVNVKLNNVNHTPSGLSVLSGDGRKGRAARSCDANRPGRDTGPECRKTKCPRKDNPNTGQERRYKELFLCRKMKLMASPKVMLTLMTLARPANETNRPNISPHGST